MRVYVAQGQVASFSSIPASHLSHTYAVVVQRAPPATGSAAATGGHTWQSRLACLRGSRLRSAAATSSQAPSKGPVRKGEKSAGNGSSNGSCNNGAGRASAESSSSGVPARPPRIPPLPYWCDGVAVIGLPDNQLVFCFQTPTQASATARRQLRPEAPYGAQAGRLSEPPCLVPGAGPVCILPWQMVRQSVRPATLIRSCRRSDHPEICLPPLPPHAAPQ